MPLFDFSNDPRAKVDRIRRRTLKMIMEASKSSFPSEFAAFLRAEEGVIKELMLLPGTVSGNSHAIFRMSMLPIDFTVVGTIHSHPSDTSLPSDADLDLFRRYGWVHIITHAPYEMDCWTSYSGRGDIIELKVVD
ncbi:MAG: Mov34/MPN/PAD-1 family protein [Thermoplasmata archaeon]|nr:Mov34/MPN/PAD-1 family protein [Thermoplasmata archaeon]